VSREKTKYIVCGIQVEFAGKSFFIKDKYSGISKGFGFVEMPSKAEA